MHYSYSLHYCFFKHEKMLFKQVLDEVMKVFSPSLTEEHCLAFQLDTK